MSEAFQKALEARQQRTAAEARTKRRILIIGAAVLILVLLFMLWRSGNKLINPNSATREQLMSLPEVGPEIADRILKLRPFTDANDLEKRVPGIGPKSLEKMKSLLDFNSDGQADCCP